MTATLLVYYAFLWLGLGTMLLDGWGWIAYIVYNVGMPAGALIIWWRYRRQLPAPAHHRYAGMVRHGASGVVLAALIPGLVIGTLATTGWASDFQHSTSTHGVLTAILIPQIAVAAFEELAFRGVMQPLLCVRFGPRSGLVLTAVLFGVFHIPNAFYQDVPPALIPQTIVTLALLGGVFGMAYRRSGQRLVLPVALHYGWNITSFSVEDLLHYDTAGPRWLTGSPTWFPESGFLSTLGVVLLAGLLVWLVFDHDHTSSPEFTNKESAD